MMLYEDIYWPPLHTMYTAYGVNCSLSIVITEDFYDDDDDDDDNYHDADSNDDDADSNRPLYPRPATHSTSH